MSFTNLPPQAYTRDVLAAAYEWLRSQPASIRELATNSDNLVSLYMQSRRRPNLLNQLVPNSVAETKELMSGAGAEAFKNDLKNLAEGLKQFEDRPTEGLQTTHQNSEMTSNQTQSVSAPPALNNSAATVGLQLDARSLETVRKVQSLFNLSHEREALRFLITVGFEKVKDFLEGRR